MKNLKRMKILFWIITLLFTVFILMSAIPSALMLPYAVDYFTNHLGYPAYMLPFTGIAKLLGLLAILVPGYHRIKEWAYAGFVFDLLGAMYSGASVGDPPGVWMPVLIDLILLVFSYILYRGIRNHSLAPEANR